jgi:hypothetical protein
MLNLLKARWVFYGLEAPIVSWAVAIGLVLFMIGYWCRMYLLVFLPIGEQIKQCRQKLVDLKNRVQLSNLGLEGQTFDEIKHIFDQHEILKPYWQGFSKRLVRRSVERSDYFWTLDSAGETFSEQALIGNRLNLSFCQSLPSIITGIGLLFTFIAILIALLDVRLNNTRVEGIDLLIQGLSGKFISSIAALFLATLHILFEKSAFHRLRNNCQQLVISLDDLFPRLTLAHLFVDVRAHVAEQTNAFRAFNNNLAPALKASISEGLGPTLERMAASLEDLNQLLRLNEEQKRESITDSIEKLLANLSDSLTKSISGMSESFSNNLIGSAQTQFSEVLTTLANTAELFSGMNNQFGSLTLKLEDMMERMSQRLESNADVTAGTAKEILKQASDWSDRSAAQVEQMLNTHQGQFARVEELRIAFTSALAGFSKAIDKHSVMIGGLGEIAGQVTATVGAINQSMLGIQSAQEAFEQVAAETRIQAEHLAKANGHQEVIWSNIESNLTNYSQTFVQVEQAAQTLFSQINEQLNNYTRATQNSYQSLVEVADNHFSNATKRLGASVDELDEVLTDLADTISETRHNGTR